MSIAISELFPGCESFLMVDEKPTEEEKQEQYTEATEMFYDVEIETMKVDQLLRNTDELLDLHEHIGKFGVDRTFLSLVNKHNRLGKFLNLQLPSYESFDVVGRPDSNLSLVCMEGVGSAIAEVFSSLWNMIKAIGNWIKTKLTQFFDWIASWFKDAPAKTKHVLAWWTKFSSGEMRSFLGKQSKIPSIKTVGKLGFEKIKEASDKIEQTLPELLNNKDNDARWASDIDALNSYLKNVAKVVAGDKITINVATQKAEGKNVNYTVDQWWTAATVVYKSLPIIQRELNQMRTILDQKFNETESYFAKAKAIATSPVNKNMFKGKPDGLKTLKEKAAGLNKLRNAITSFASGVLTKVFQSLDNVEKTLDKVISEYEASKGKSSDSSNNDSGMSAKSETS